jgi:hypothetical protein
MVSLWGSKDGEENEEGQNETTQSTSHTQHPHESEDANERTRLLHPPPLAPNRGDGYLDPDDPAVCRSVPKPALQTDTYRSLPTIFGPSGLYATSKSSSS